MNTINHHENDQGNCPDLDSLLFTWAEAQAAPETVVRQLSVNISEAIAKEPFLQLAGVPDRPRRLSKTSMLVGFGGGLAASLLLMVATRSMLFPRAEIERPLHVAGGPNVVRPEPPASAVWQPQELAEKSRLLREVNREFDGGVAWLAESGGKMDLHVIRREDAADGVALAMRLVLVRRARGEQQWKQTWSTDVVTHSEQVVDALPGTSSASVWAYVLPDGLISADCDLRLESPLGARVKFSGLLENGVPRQVLSLETSEEEWRLYQTVMRLPGSAT